MPQPNDRFDVQRATGELFVRGGCPGGPSAFKVLPPIYQTYHIALDLDDAVLNEGLDTVLMYRAEYVLAAPKAYRAIGAEQAAAFFERVIEAAGCEAKVRRIGRDPEGALSPKVLARLSQLERTYDRRAQDVPGLLDRFVAKHEARFRRALA